MAIRWKYIKNKPRLHSLCVVKGMAPLIGKFEGTEWHINAITHIDKVPVTDADKWCYWREIK